MSSKKPGTDIRSFFIATPKKEPKSSPSAASTTTTPSTTSTSTNTTTLAPTVVKTEPIKNHDISSLTNTNTETNQDTPNSAYSSTNTKEASSMVVKSEPEPAPPKASPAAATKRTKVIADTDSEEDDADADLPRRVKKPALAATKAGTKKKNKFEDSSASEVSSEESDDAYSSDGSASEDEGMHDESEEEEQIVAPKKRASAAKSTTTSTTPRKPAARATSTVKKEPAASPTKAASSMNMMDDDMADSTPSSSSSFSNSNSGTTDMDSEYMDLLPSFLKPECIRDKNRNRPDHPEYNAKTLYIPPEDLKQMTPAQRQFWEIKSANMDVVLFFKMGKFYELFDLDAEVGIRELGLVKMNGNRLHAGFPEAAFVKYAQILVKKGYKIGRVEQTQTPKQLQEANAKAPKGQKASVVKREMCQLLSTGTIADGQVLGTPESNILLSIYEHVLVNTDAMCEVSEQDKQKGAEVFLKQEYVEHASIIGLCVTDVSTGCVQVVHILDDSVRTNLTRIIAQLRVVEIVYCKDTISNTTLTYVLRNTSPHVVQSPLAKPDTYTNLEDLYTFLHIKQFFNKTNTINHHWPKVLLDQYEVLSNPAVDKSNKTYLQSFVLMQAFGYCVTYLTRMLVVEEVLSLKHVVPLLTEHTMNKYMILPSSTLTNLYVLQNEQGGRQGTILEYLDHCSTSFGKRLLRRWVCQPLTNTEDIQLRVDGVKELLGQPDLVNELRMKLKKMPDVDRLLSRVHANSLKKEQTAIMYENIGKIHVEVFIKTLQGFHDAIKIFELLTPREFTSTILQQISNLTYSDDFLTRRYAHSDDKEKDGAGGASELRAGNTLDILSQLVKEFQTAFDANQALKDGYIVPKSNILPEYDQAKAAVKQAELALDEYLQEQKKIWGRDVCYFHRAKEVYQLEIPLTSISKTKVPSTYTQTSSTKKVLRYYTDEIRQMIDDLEAAQEQLESILKDITRQVFGKFAQDYSLWRACIDVLSVLDCLLSLTRVSHHQTPSTPPCFDTTSTQTLYFEDSIHPTACHSTFASNNNSTQFIPNTIEMHTDTVSQYIMLISGPNMGGKSTILRQVSTLCIMSQLGCYITATNSKLSPVDAIYTRIGASDRIMQGQSTFLMELQETSHILHHATKHSLVIMDELGRGTATFDGTAIAHGVLQYIKNTLQCRTLFATHYHSLLQETQNDKQVRRCYMGCNVTDATPMAYTSSTATSTEEKQEEEESTSSSTTTVQNIQFTYKLMDGVSAKSFGINVAKLAGLPNSVVVRADDMAKKLEYCMQHSVVDKRNVLVNILRGIQDTKNINELLTQWECVLQRDSK